MLTRKTALLLGWYGVLAILAAYAGLNFGYFGSRTVVYQLLNLTGATALIAETWKRRDLQPMFLNIIWFLVALIAIFGIIRP